MPQSAQLVLSHQIPHSDSAVAAWDPKQFGPLPTISVSSPKKRGRGDGAAHLRRGPFPTTVLEAGVRAPLLATAIRVFTRAGCLAEASTLLEATPALKALVWF